MYSRLANYLYTYTISSLIFMYMFEFDRPNYRRWESSLIERRTKWRRRYRNENRTFTGKKSGDARVDCGSR